MIERKKSSADFTVLAKSLRQLQKARAVGNQFERKAALRDYYFPVASQRYEYVLIFVNWLIVIGYFWESAIELKQSATPHWQIFLCAPIAFFIADLMSAGFHKWLDSYASETNLLWGSAAKAFRIHHEFPKNLNGATYWHNVSAFAPFMTFLFMLVFVARFAVPFHPCVSFAIGLLIVLFSQGTETHRQSHVENPPRWIRFLQSTRIILSPALHRLHHTHDLDSDYGIINGWSNGILTSLDVWPKLDRWLYRRLGIFPRNWVQVSSSIPREIILELKQDLAKVPAELQLYQRVFPKRSVIFEFTDMSALQHLELDEVILSNSENPLCASSRDDSALPHERLGER